MIVGVLVNIFSMLSILLLTIKSHEIVIQDGVHRYEEYLNAGETLSIAIKDPGTRMLFANFDDTVFTVTYKITYEHTVFNARVFNFEEFNPPFLDYQENAGDVQIRAENDTVVVFTSYKIPQTCKNHFFIANTNLDVIFSPKVHGLLKLSRQKPRCIFVTTPEEEDYKLNVNIGGKSQVILTTPTDNTTYTSDKEFQLDNISSLFIWLDPDDKTQISFLIQTIGFGRGDSTVPVSNFVSEGQTFRIGNPTRSPTPNPTRTPLPSAEKNGLPKSLTILITSLTSVVVVAVVVFVVVFRYMRRGYTYSDEIAQKPIDLMNTLLEDDD